MHQAIHHRLAGAALILCTSASASAADAPGYHLEKVVTIKSSDTGWDYNALDAQRGHLFIAHRADGLHVYDTRAGKMIKTLKHSEDTNTAALALEFDLGIAGTTEGDVILFRPSSLKTIKRFKSSTGGFDGATYDPASRRFAMVGEADTDKGTTPVLFFDARTGQQVGEVVLHSIKVDAPRPDGQGNIYLPLRDRALVARIDARALKEAGELKLGTCLQPSSLDLDLANQRLFVGCRGKDKVAPQLAVLDARDGRAIASLPIGRGVDEVMYDAKSATILTANGQEATMSVIAQDSPEKYRLAQTIGTRPMARTGVLDEATGKVFLVNAQYVESYNDAGEASTRFLPNTFSVLTYAR
ncbi:hypothetical protein GCM10027321_21390 [Massilia terrae]|uniref:Uncharacterized protein n=1 Tax=Massilia terrae TaxID=1811224 RepID=A0ABT2CYB4_9BURK|nr:hypothetical protein [Massilia terrae]MCS0658965.1 hypothetical protein [Massilia terrae]